MEHLTLKAVTTATDQGTFEAVISAESVDREKDIVDAPAMVEALRKWNRPIPLSWDHSTDAKDIFGSIDPESVREVDGEVVVTGQVDLESEVGKEAWRSFKSRTIGFSFGYLIPEGGASIKGDTRHITAIDVFEVTATPTPMNNDTRVLSTKAMEEAAEQTETSGEEPADEKSVAIEDAADEEPKPAKSHAQDPLRRRSLGYSLDVLSDGLSKRTPPQPKEEPEPVPVPDRNEVKRLSREAMLDVLRS